MNVVYISTVNVSRGASTRERTDCEETPIVLYYKSY